MHLHTAALPRDAAPAPWRGIINSSCCRCTGLRQCCLWVLARAQGAVARSPGHSWVPLAAPELLREMFCFQFLCWGCAGNALRARGCGEGTGAAGHGQSSQSSGASAGHRAGAAQPCSTRAQTQTLSSLSLCPRFQGRVSLHRVPSAAATAHPFQIAPAPPSPAPHPESSPGQLHSDPLGP